jgi:hypothetical protein
MMSIEEFNKTGFGAGMKAKYRNSIHHIVSVNFMEALVELECEQDESMWARCENIELI